MPHRRLTENTSFLISIDVKGGYQKRFDEILELESVFVILLDLFLLTCAIKSGIRVQIPPNYTFKLYLCFLFYSESYTLRREGRKMIAARRGTQRSVAANASTVEHEEIFSAVCVLFVQIKEYFQNISPESCRHYLRGYRYSFVRRVREAIIFPVIRPRYFLSFPRSPVPPFRSSRNPMRFLTFRELSNVSFGLLCLLLCLRPLSSVATDVEGKRKGCYPRFVSEGRANGRKEISEIKRADIAARVFRGCSPFHSFHGKRYYLRLIICTTRNDWHGKRG